MKKVFFKNDLFFINKKNAGKNSISYECKVELWARAYVSRLFSDEEIYNPTTEEEKVLLDAEFISAVEFKALLIAPNNVVFVSTIKDNVISISEKDDINCESENFDIVEHLKESDNVLNQSRLLTEKFENIFNTDSPEIDEKIQTDDKVAELQDVIYKFQHRLEALEAENKTLKAKKILSYEESIEILNKKNNISKLIKSYEATSQKIDNLKIIINQSSDTLSLEDEKLFLRVESEGFKKDVIFSTSSKFLLTDFVNYTSNRIAEEIEKNKSLLLSL